MGIDALVEVIAGAPAEWEARLRTPAQRFAVGDRVGPFRLLRRLGAGGMGEVFEAEQDSPRRRVALKVLHPESLGSIGMRRIHAEATLLAHSSHPGIVSVYAAGTVEDPNGLPVGYLAMELVREALPLTVAADARHLDLRGRVELMRQLAEAVAHAHDEGVVHLDLKPTNALVDKDCRVKLIDFGLARAAGGVIPLTDCPTGNTGWIGTYEYMAPEQFLRTPAACDQRADVYALGVMLHELLTGQRPINISGMSPFQIAETLRTAVPPDPSQFGPSVPPSLAAIVARCLEPIPDMRYACGGDLRKDLDRWLTGGPPQATSRSLVGRAWRRLRLHAKPIGTAALLCLGVSLLVLGVALVSNATARRDRAERSLRHAITRDASAALGRGQLALALFTALRIPEQTWETRAFAAIASQSLFHLTLPTSAKRVAFTREDRSLICLDLDGTLWLYSILDGVLEELAPPAERVEDMLRIPGSDVLALRASTGETMLARLSEEGTLTTHPIGHSDQWTTIASRLALVSGNTLTILEVSSLTDTRLLAEMQADGAKSVAWLHEDEVIIAFADRIERWTLGPAGTLTSSLLAREPSAPGDRLVAVGGTLFRTNPRSGLARRNGDRWEHFPSRDFALDSFTAVPASDGRRIAVGHGTGVHFLADRDSAAMTGIISSHTSPISDIAWSSDDRYFATASIDCSVRVWPSDTTFLQPRRDTASRLAESIAQIDISTDGDLLASLSPEGVVQVDRLRPIHELLARVPCSGVRTVAVSSESATLFVATTDTLYGAPLTGGPWEVLASLPAAPISMLHRTGSLTLLLSSGVVLCVDAASHRIRWESAPHTVDPKTARLVRASDAAVVVRFASRGHVASAFDPRTGRQIATLDEPSSGVIEVDYASTQRAWIFTDANQRASRVDRDGTLTLGTSGTVAVSGSGGVLTPDESRFIVCGPLGQVSVIDTETVDVIAWFAAEAMPAGAMRFAEEADVLTVAAVDGRVRQYNSRSPIRQPEYFWRPEHHDGKLGFRLIARDEAQARYDARRTIRRTSADR